MLISNMLRKRAYSGYDWRIPTYESCHLLRRKSQFWGSLLIIVRSFPQPVRSRGGESYDTPPLSPPHNGAPASPPADIA